MKRRLMVFGAVELRFSLNNKDLGVNSACVRVSAGFILDYSLLVRRVFSSANYSDRAVWNFELSRPFFLVQCFN
ncbi:hypothetical protein RchiOBHm_Chr5g0060791 [Rosa chinensis]|uniref:Uncharacterized protein n=1 Tax=Rosa chinensis TaxID=74649 RepID=A0A2P6QHS1_ROSCH|nr:hypothetical protein RchiOBHm_Chr5g0060791 [Rosa chinensis]